MKKKDTVALIGFGTFKMAQRKARKGRNPGTGEEIKIKAKKVPRFVPGKALKDAAGYLLFKRVVYFIIRVFRSHPLSLLPPLVAVFVPL